MKKHTKAEVRRLEAAAHKAWSAGFPTLNFPYDLDVRFGTLEREVYRDPGGAFVNREIKALAAQVVQIKR